MWEILLEIAIASSDRHHAIAYRLLKITRHYDLACYATKRIFRRLISIRRRIGCGALDMRIIVRRSGRKIDDLYPKLTTELKESNSLRQIVFQRIRLANPKTIDIRQALAEILRNTSSRFSSA